MASENRIFLTFDQEWAPPWATEEICTRVSNANLSATFFVTHACPSLDRLRDSKAFELGWHPNFLPGSTQGKNEIEILDELRKIVPDATGVRAHWLVRGTHLLDRYHEAGLRYEASDLMDGLSGLRPLATWNGMLRLPIYWEDDIHLRYKRSCGLESMKLEQPGMKILNFHPVLIALNASTMKTYEAFKVGLDTRGTSLSEATRDDFAPFREKGKEGIGTLFDAAIQLMISNPDRAGGRLGELLLDR